MEATLLVPRLSVYILMSLGIVLVIVLLIQLIAGLYNVIINYHRKTMTNKSHVFNLFIFHHLIICIIRCIITFTICYGLIIYDKCLSLEFFIHFLLLLSTFDVFLIIIGEIVHFWDSSINYKSTLYSKYCLIFGLFFLYFLASLFISIHLTMGGDNPLVINICNSVEHKILSHPSNDNEKSIIPTIIIYVLFILLDLLTLAWIYTAYKDIAKLKRKRLATVFFYSLVFTKYKEQERSNMVNRSLRRLTYTCLFILSNIIVILPVLTTKTFKITLNIYIRIILIHLTMLPWFESLTCLFFKEMKFDCTKRPPQLKATTPLQQRVGTRLSSYRENFRRTSNKSIEIKSIEG